MAQDRKRSSQLKAFITRHALPLTEEWMDLITTHNSFHVIDSTKESNEKLEALGDSVLDLIVMDWLYEKFPQGNEGAYTQLRSEIVSNSVLGVIGKDLGLEPLMLAGSGGAINAKQLADCVEALFGGLYKFHDSHRNDPQHLVKHPMAVNPLQICKDQFEAVFTPILSEIAHRNFVPWRDNKNELNPKNMLQDYLLKRGLPSAKLELIDESGPPHQRTFTSRYTLIIPRNKTEGSKLTEENSNIDQVLIGIGVAPSKRESEKQAAADLLQKLL